MRASAAPSARGAGACRAFLGAELGVAGLEQPAAVALLGDVAAEQRTGLDVDGACRRTCAANWSSWAGSVGWPKPSFSNFSRSVSVVEEVIGMRSATLDSVCGSSV